VEKLWENFLKKCEKTVNKMWKTIENLFILLKIKIKKNFTTFLKKLKKI